MISKDKVLNVLLEKIVSLNNNIKSWKEENIEYKNKLHEYIEKGTTIPEQFITDYNFNSRVLGVMNDQIVLLEEIKNEILKIED